jgi:hypothetical protein
MRRVLLILGTLVLALAVVPVARASVSGTVTIATTKPLGPFPGTFAASGAISDTGVLRTLNLNFSAIPAPDHVIDHLTLRFEGTRGTFTVKAQIRESVTDNPLVLADTGVWEIIDGTGVYASLHGGGTVVGTVDDAQSLVTRIYSGQVHLD